MVEWLVALVVGAVQGLLEWLPVSSEGAVAVALTVLDTDPEAATQFALFLHAGTAVAAAVYYRDVLVDVLRDLPSWRPGSAFGDQADLTFFAIATLVSGFVGVAGYLGLSRLAAAISEAEAAAAGGIFVAFIGALLFGTGLLMRTAQGRAREMRTSPDALDALLVGTLQGLAVLPGVSRSGTTVSALLLRGHDGENSLRLSFVLSIPAALGAGLIVVLDDGLPTITPGPALVALALSAVIGYLVVDVLVRIVERVDFWRVCVGFGGLAVLGGGLLLL
ncbi:MAG: undecaprenyl-diphosphatase [Haloarculaceae archaeon]|jgi:undecaprenyl-diphosphatase